MNKHPLHLEFMKDKIYNGPGAPKDMHTYSEEWVEDKLGHEYKQGKMPPEVDTVFFTFPEADKKKNIFQGFEFASRQVLMKKKKGDKSQINLFIPELVQIDYSEYSDVSMFKNTIYAKPYKDGIMIISDVDRGNRRCLALELGDVNKTTISDGKVVATLYQNRFRNFGQVDWTSKNFDNQLVFYVVVPKIIKNKAARIVFKNNIRVNKLKKLFRSGPQRRLPTGEFKHFFDSTTKIHDILSGITLCQKDEKKKKFYNYNTTYPKHSLLKASYQSALIEFSNECIVANHNGYGSKDYWQDIKKYKNKSLEEIRQEYMKDIFPFEKDLEISIIQNMEVHNKEKNKTVSTYFHKNLLKMAIFYYHTNKGTTLCNGVKIDPEKKSRVDCLLFWKKIDLFELLFNILNKKNFPLCIRNSQVINDVDIFDPILNSHISLMGHSPYAPRPEAAQGNAFGKMKFEFKNKHILEEAINNQTGHHLVPYDGAFELLHDPFFKCIRFREYRDIVTAVVLDKNERHFVEVFSKTEVDFKYMLWNQMKFNENYSEECMQEIYTKIATVIRDSYVLIERDRTMGYGGKRRPYGMNTDSEYNIYYFPRKRYRYKNNGKAEKAFFRETRKFSGIRRAHTRELPENYKPSDKQLLLAKSLDWYVPDGCTFVEEAQWGVKMTKKEIKYRHTCLNNLFYYDNREVSEAHKINQLSSTGFEEHCEARVKKLGYSIKSCQNHDGGIDIRATKILDNGEVEYLLVQCKHWNKPIPPGEMRDFKTACDMEESKYKKTYMFMTSNKFSPGAQKIAEKFNIELIDGDDLIK